MATVQDQDKPEINEGDRVYKFSDMVDFKITYPKDFKKENGKPMPKYYKDGEVISIHKAQAEDWAQRGLGSIQKKTK